MRKRHKLVKSHKSDCDKNAQILHLEELICDSHTQEKLHDEEISVTKIKTDPNYFFYRKNFYLQKNSTTTKKYIYNYVQYLRPAILKYMSLD